MTTDPMVTAPRLPAVLLVLALVAIASPALGHGSFLDVRPLPGVTVGGRVEEVAFLFPEEVFPDGATIAVTAPDGSTVADRGGLQHPEGGVIRQPIRRLTDAGEYGVDYSVPAYDGSRFEGSFTFEFRPDAQPLDPLPFGRDRSVVPSVIAVLGLVVIVVVAVRRRSSTSDDPGA